MRRMSELTLADGDGVSIHLHDSQNGLCLTVERDGKEGPEVCLLPYQRRQVLHFLLDCDLADEVNG